ncbi:MAG: phosphoglucosamine mutase, partial [bacterium]
MNGGLKISVSGFRGIVGEDLTPERIIRFAASFALHRKGKIVIGHDTRISSEPIKKLIVGTLQSMGSEIVDIGVVPTPTCGIAVKELGACGGIMITASHNPEHWNGIKFLKEDGGGIEEDEIMRIAEFSEKGGLEWAKYDKLGVVRNWDGAIDLHIRKVLNLPFFDLDEIRSMRLQVVYDGNNGAGCVAIPGLLGELGCDVVVINGEPNGRFSHKLEPTPDALYELGEAVKEVTANLGLATDPDADRLAIVDETGNPISEEFTLAFAADYLLSKNPGPVVVNLSTSSLIDYVAENYGVPVYRTKVGELNVARMLTKIGGVIGGEGNGGVIVPPVHIGRDSLVASALIIAYIRQKNKNVSALVNDFPR